MSFPRGTGSAAADSRDDFMRARRAAQLAKLRARLARRPGEVDMMLPFDEVVSALGRRGERRLGEQVVELDAIVGSVDRQTGFDRRFRPTTGLARQRFETISRIVRSGGELPPVELYKVGEAYFVRDGHHRIAVARALGWSDVNAVVTEILTAVGAHRDLTAADLPLKGHERLFWERVPLAPSQRPAVVLADPWEYGDLAESVEAWGFRHMQARGSYLSREQVAQVWFAEEFLPTVALLREAGLHPGGTDAEAYMELSCQRYRLLRTHSWDDPVLDRLRAARHDGARSGSGSGEGNRTR